MVSCFLELPAMCPLEQASATAWVSMIAPLALLTIKTPFLHFAILFLSNNPLNHNNVFSHYPLLGNDQKIRILIFNTLFQQKKQKVWNIHKQNTRSLLY